LFSASWRDQRLDLPKDLTMTIKISDAVPSPWGEGQGEGELNENRASEKN
jgi:hypothetical protein